MSSPHMPRKRPIDPLAQLAASVLARETTELPWRLLRHSYFTGRWEREALRGLKRWAEKHGITVDIERSNGPDDTSIRFSIP